MKAKIIDFNINKTSEELFAEGMNVSVEELRNIRKDIRDGRKKRRKEAEEYNKKYNSKNGKEMIIEYCPPVQEGKVMFYDNLQKDLRKTFKYYKEQERKHMREKLKDFKIPYKSLIKRI